MSKTDDERTAGSLDEAPPPHTMEAVDLALRRYFDAEDWLETRNQERPGLRRSG